MNGLKDNFFRVIDYLRLSVTDRCNLRCVYCMPSSGIPTFAHKDILTYEEIIRIVGIAAGLGVHKVRITGGEPLSRKNISFLISSIKKINGIEDLSMTTNGVLLEKYSKEISDAGLDRINVSIDSFKPQRYKEITRGGDLNSVLRGLDIAEKAGLNPIKINMVPIRGVNDDEIIDFAKLTVGTEYHVRFIEFMPSGFTDFWSPRKYITTDEIKNLIEKNLSPITPVRVRKNGPSKYFRIKGAKGVIGFISALTHHFCEDCNRIRLTSDGKIRPCLFSETEIDLLSSIRRGSTDSEIERLMRFSVEVKPKGHDICNGPNGIAPHPSLLDPRIFKRPMSKIGG
ncbi:MAG: GTP 3',8-cyclase MoaA [Nitrospirota bacterium]